VLGREAGSDIHVDDQEVSRRHAELRTSGAGHVIVDLHSLNGLVAGGQRFDQRALQDGDEIRIGQRVTMRYVASAAERARAAPRAAASTAAVPEGWYADPGGSSA